MIHCYRIGNPGLQGTLPHNLITQAPNLAKLNLANNQLSGTLTELFDNLANIQHLVLHGQRLSGTMPSFDQGSLNLFSLARNLMTGETDNLSGLDNEELTSTHTSVFLRRPFSFTLPLVLSHRHFTLYLLLMRSKEFIPHMLILS